MKPATAIFAFALLTLSLAAQAGDEPSYGNRVVSTDAVAKSRPGSFDVFIDSQTGYAFVNTPKGWKFVRKVPDQSAVVRQVESPAKPDRS